jgi:hypothetical protein
MLGAHEGMAPSELAHHQALLFPVERSDHSRRIDLLIFPGERDLRRTSLSVCLLAPLLLMSATGALACEGPRTLLSEDFKFVDDAWTQGPHFVIANGKGTIVTDISSGRSILYGNATYGDIDICMTMAMPPDVGNAGQVPAGVGILFWSVDTQNQYLAAIYGNGNAGVYRLAGNAWTTLTIREAVNPPIRTESGARNTLRVTLSGSTAIFSVNGARVAGFRSDQPAGFRGRIGLFAQSGSSRAVPFDVLGLKVTDLAKE